MITRKRTIDILLLVCLLATLFPTDALAYLDPGTGSLVVQGILATLAAAGYALRLYWRRIGSWFNPSNAPDESDSQDGRAG